MELWERYAADKWSGLKLLSTAQRMGSCIWLRPAAGARNTSWFRLSGHIHEVAEMLSARNQEKSNPDDLVFPAPQGNDLSYLNFRRRA